MKGLPGEIIVLDLGDDWARLVEVLNGDAHSTLVSYQDQDENIKVHITVYDYQLKHLKGPVPCSGTPSQLRSSSSASSLPSG